MLEIPKQNKISELIVNNILSNIASGEFKTGDSLPTEIELSQLYRVSRSTIRESLRILETYGIIETSKRNPPKIINRNLEAAINIASIQLGENTKYYEEIHTVRQLLENGLIENILENATEKDIQDLEEINNKLNKLNKLSDSAEIDFNFHLKLVEIAKNSLIKSIYQTLTSKIKYTMKIGKITEKGVYETFLKHLAIIEALKTKNTIILREAMTKHFEPTAKLLKEIKDKNLKK